MKGREEPTEHASRIKHVEHRNKLKAHPNWLPHDPRMWIPRFAFATAQDALAEAFENF